MEDFAGVWEVVLWALAAVVKFVFTPSAMVARGVDAPTTVAVTTAGAAVGTAVFYYGARATFARLRARRHWGGLGALVFGIRRRGRGGGRRRRRGGGWTRPELDAPRWVCHRQYGRQYGCQGGLEHDEWIHGSRS